MLSKYYLDHTDFFKVQFLTCKTNFKVRAELRTAAGAGRGACFLPTQQGTAHV